MTVKTGQAWAGMFVTLDADGALAAGTPAGALYVDGVANAAMVTITGANPYKFSVTLPALTAGQRVDMYITATINTILTASVVASDQADTSLLSEVNTALATLDAQLSAIPNEASVYDGKTYEELIKLFASALLGLLSRSADGTTLTFRDLLDTKNRIITTQNPATGERTNQTLDGS